MPDIGPDIEPDIGYAVYDIDDMMARYRVAPDIGTNIGVNVTRYLVSISGHKKPISGHKKNLIT
jgi:hypothetical protein